MVLFDRCSKPSIPRVAWQLVGECDWPCHSHPPISHESQSSILISVPWLYILTRETRGLGYGRLGSFLHVKRFHVLILTSLVLITGVSPNSIGEALTIALAAHQPGLLILASRTLSKIQAVTRLAHASHPQVRIEEVVVDLSSLKSVRKAAGEIKEIVERGGGGIDVLFNNAGINISERRLSDTGVELQFATNHLGPFLLTNILLPSMNSGKGRARVINTSSEAHRISPVRFSDIHQTPGAKVEFDDHPRRGMPEGILRGDGTYEPSIAYGQSKTANVLFAVGLNRRGVKSFAVTPGSTSHLPFILYLTPPHPVFALEVTSSPPLCREKGHRPNSDKKLG
jgi:NAD(P)-dependent dehydrogenase (short-subunit alcohol dehydrogenase family)